MLPTTTSSTPIGSPTVTMQSGPLRLEDLEPLPAFTSPPYTSTTVDASNTVRAAPDPELVISGEDAAYTSTALDASNTERGAPEPTISVEDDESLLIDEAERGVLLSQIESIGHECEGDEGCLACLFKSYQRLCATALHHNELQIADVADVVALLGVLVPFKATNRMKTIFQERTLDDLRKSDEEWPDVGFDENLVTSAVRVSLASILN